MFEERMLTIVHLSLHQDSRPIRVHQSQSKSFKMTNEQMIDNDDKSTNNSIFTKAALCYPTPSVAHDIVACLRKTNTHHL